MEPLLTPETYKVLQALPSDWTNEAMVTAALARELPLTRKSIARRMRTLETCKLIEGRYPKGLGVTREIRRILAPASEGVPA